MNILGTQYSLSTKSFDIYLAGCNEPHCKNCHNPESWDFNLGSPPTTEFYQTIYQKIQKFDALIDKIFILGGEPLDQGIRLEYFLAVIKSFGKPIWLFTKYELNEVPENIKCFCSYIKTGRYVDELKTDNNNQFGISLSSSNQKIHQL